ncbi:MAG TPA: amino acid ABC transporter substrate-binding protein [Candidatus Bathyarchaeia archaeon]|nr:amino acid ABC transporter substrate-binding protein [Candidatus Bathyarchaeia archaeon]
MSSKVTRTSSAIIVIVIIVIAAIGLGVYYSSRPTTNVPTATVQTSIGPAATVIKIGMTTPLSGSLAADGQMSLNGLQLWASNVNATGGIYVQSLGKKLPVQLIYYDDQSNTARVAALYPQLVASNVNFLIAPYSSPLTLAAAPIAEQHQMLLLSHGGSSDTICQKGYKYIVQVLAPASTYMIPVADLLATVTPKPSTIAFFYGNDPFSISVFKGLSPYATKLGYKIVYNQTYDESASDYTSQMTQIAALKPDVLLGGAHFVDGETIMKNIRSLGINFKAIALLVAPDDPRFKSDLGPVANYVMVPAQWESNLDFSKFSPFGNITSTQFVSEFTSRFGIVPNYEAAEAYATGLTLEKAVYDSGSLDNTVVRNQLGTENFYTFYGGFKIDSTGLQVGHSMVVAQWQSGIKQTIWPGPVATAPPLYPIPTSS